MFRTMTLVTPLGLDGTLAGALVAAGCAVGLGALVLVGLGGFVRVGVAVGGFFVGVLVGGTAVAVAVGVSVGGIAVAVAVNVGVGGTSVGGTEVAVGAGATAGAVQPISNAANGRTAVKCRSERLPIFFSLSSQLDPALNVAEYK